MPHPKFTLKQSADERFYFNLTGRHGQVILTSQFYNSKSSAINGIVAVQINSTREDRFAKNKSFDDQFYFFTLKANNGMVIGLSEKYTTAEARDISLESVRQNGFTKEIEDTTLAMVD